MAHSSLQPPYVLSLDIGSSSARAMVFDRTGNPLPGSLARQTYLPNADEPGSLVLDPDQLLQIIYTCLDACLAQLGEGAAQIAAVATCTFAGSTLGLDEMFQPVTPLILYADTRSTQDVAILKKNLNEARLHQRTGVYFQSSYLPARLLWLQRTDPVAFDRIEYWVTFGEYLALRLFGARAVSHSIASWIGMEDIRRLDWDRGLLNFLPITRENLSPLVDASTPFQELRIGYALRWPALAKIPWFPAIGDGAAANLGSGCISSRQVAITIGTSSAVRTVLSDTIPDIPAGLWCYRVDRRRALLGGALSEGGNVFAWMTRWMGLQPGSAVEAEIAQQPPDAHGLTFLPLIAGERSPGMSSDAHGMLAGLSLSTTSLQVLRAGLEGVAYRIAQLYDLVKPVIPEHPQIVGTGGGLEHSPVWAQILADVIGEPVYLSRVAESTARGVALLALESLGILGDISQVPAVLGREFTPDPERHAIYRSAMQRQQRLYRLFWP